MRFLLRGAQLKIDRHIVRLAAAFVLFGAAPCLAAPLAAYGALPSIEDVALSSDGAKLAVVVTKGELRNVAIETVADQKVVVTVRAGDQKVRDIQWAGADHLLVSVSTTTAIHGLSSPWGEWWTVTDIDLKHGKQHRLLDDSSSAGMDVIYGRPRVRTIDGKTYAFIDGVQWVADEGWLSLFKVDLDTGHSDLVAKGDTRNTDGWLVDPSGRPVARTEYDDEKNRWSLQVRQGDGWRTAKTLQTQIEIPSLVGFGPGGHTLLLEDSEGGEVSYREMAPDAADWGAALDLPGNPGVLTDPATDEMTGTRRIVGDRFENTYLARSEQANWDAVSRIFPGDLVSLESESADHRKLVVKDDSPTLGPAYSLVDLDAHTARWIGPAYFGLAKGDVSPVKAVSFKAADGLDLTGYLTLPLGRDPKDLPLIVFPHGGPSARDTPGFDWWAQAMASRGYAVLQVNYRGSDGLGWKFLSAGFGEWGRKMQTDLSDGVRYLAGQRLIDPKRVCIVGASYGGYAALAGVTLDPGVYRCAVAVAGISDLRQMIGEKWGKHVPLYQRYWERYMGAKAPDDPHLNDISPIKHIDGVTAPILLIHGEDDTVVDFEQSQFMRSALRAHGKSVDLVTLTHEDHWLSHGDTRLQMLQATMDFLAKNNPAE
jgi:dipeptidyl aminopeptidase/acylaminoacyl peptidase